VLGELAVLDAEEIIKGSRLVVEGPLGNGLPDEVLLRHVCALSSRYMAVGSSVDCMTNASDVMIT